MHRRSACRLLAGLLLAGLGCGPSAPPTNKEPVELPPNRFPGARNKRTDPKGNPPAKGS